MFYATLLQRTFCAKKCLGLPRLYKIATPLSNQQNVTYFKGKGIECLEGKPVFSNISEDSARINFFFTSETLINSELCLCFNIEDASH